MASHAGIGAAGLFNSMRLLSCLHVLRTGLAPKPVHVMEIVGAAAQTLMYQPHSELDRTLFFWMQVKQVVDPDAVEQLRKTIAFIK